MQCAACVQEGEANVTTFENEDTLRCHVALRHVFWIPFECILCPPMTLLPTETVLKQHYDKVHPRTIPKAIYTYEEEKKKEMHRILTSSMTPPHTDTLKIELQRSKVSNTPTRPSHGLSFTSDQRHSADVVDAFARESTSITLRHYSPNDKDDDVQLVTVKQTNLTTALNINESNNDVNESNSDVNESNNDVNESNNDVNESNNDVNESNNDVNESNIDIGGQNEMNSPIITERRIKAISLAREKAQVRGKKQTEKAEVKGKKQTSQIECRLCSTLLPSDQPENKKQHVWRQHMPRAPLQCRLCSWKQYAPKAREQLRHIRLAHPEANQRPLSQSFKDYRHKLADRFNRQLQRAFAQAAVICSKESRTVKTRTVEDTCKLCQQNVGRKARCLHIWQYHMICKRYECDTCDHDTTYLKLIKRHAAEKHAQSGICWMDKMNLLQRDYNLVSAKAFGGSDPDQSDDHNETNSGRFSRQSENGMSKSGTKEVHISKCNLCNKTLNNRTTHIWNNHMEQKRYRCMLCPYGEQSVSSMKAHASRHHGEAKDACWTDHNQELSGHYGKTYLKAFGSHKEKLSKKQQAVSERKGKKKSIEKKTDGRLVCNICKKETALKHKSNHIWMWHTKEKRFACTMCDYTVANSDTAKNHARSKHNCADAGLCVTDRRVEMIEEHDRALLIAFGGSATASNTHTDE